MAGAAQIDRSGRNASRVCRDPAAAPGIGQFALIESVAPSVGLDVICDLTRADAVIECVLRSMSP